jgi:hydroxypyruvate isomerase
MMTVIAGNDQKGMTKKEMHANVITALKMAAPICEDEGVMMILEPMNIRKDHKGHCLYGSPDPVRICREVDSPMCKINWDLYHMQITEGDLCRRLREGYDQVGYLQLADNPGRNEPGTGEINYSRVLQEAWKLGYRGLVGAECSPRNGELIAARRLVATDKW